MGLWEYTQQGKGGEWSEWTKQQQQQIIAFICRSKVAHLFLFNNKLCIFMELWSLPSLCTRRSFTIAHKSCSCVSHLGTPACPLPLSLPQWQLAIKRHQESKHRKTSWLELGVYCKSRGGRRRGRRRRRLVALARSFQGDSLTQPRVSLNTLYEGEHKPYAHVFISLKISVVSHSRVPRTIAVIPTGCLLACHKI